MVPTPIYCNAQDLGCRAQKRQAGTGAFRTILLIRALRPETLGGQVLSSPPGRFVSVMWWPLLFRRPHCFRCLCRLDTLRERIEARTQRLNLQALPVHDIAQFDVGALQERYFRFQPLDYFAVHFDSVTARGRNGAFTRTGAN